MPILATNKAWMPSILRSSWLLKGDMVGASNMCGLGRRLRIMESKWRKIFASKDSGIVSIDEAELFSL